MKTISAPKAPVPRLNSLLHRLQKTPGPDDEPYLDQLMIFLENPPDGITDRWKAGAEMCTAWGVATTGSSVYRLFQSYTMEWRARLALQIEEADAVSAEALGEKVTRLMTLRVGAMLANPATPPAAIVSLVHHDLRQKYLELARQKHADAERDQTERALNALNTRASYDREAQCALVRLKESLGIPVSPWVSLFNAAAAGYAKKESASSAPSASSAFTKKTP